MYAINHLIHHTLLCQFKPMPKQRRHILKSNFKLSSLLVKKVNLQDTLTTLYINIDICGIRNVKDWRMKEKNN